MSKYQVIVGNCGVVYDGEEKEKALIDYFSCVEISKNTNNSRMYKEDVILFEDGEMLKEHNN